VYPCALAQADSMHACTAKRGSASCARPTCLRVLRCAPKSCLLCPAKRLNCTDARAANLPFRGEDGRPVVACGGGGGAGAGALEAFLCKTTTSGSYKGTSRKEKLESSRSPAAISSRPLISPGRLWSPS
jgi:hypothetical protein